MWNHETDELLNAIFAPDDFISMTTLKVFQQAQRRCEIAKTATALQLESRNQHGQDVFFCPAIHNGMRPAKRAGLDFIGSRTHVIEYDNLPLDEQIARVRTFPIPATYAVFTGNKSIHWYWILQDVESPDQWSETQRRLLQYFDGSDQAMGRLTQPVRLPGFKHRKTGKDAVILHDHSSKQTVANAVFMAVLPTVAPKRAYADHTDMEALEFRVSQKHAQQVDDALRTVGRFGGDMGDRITYRCFEHEDTSPSAVFFKGSCQFFCSSCNAHGAPKWQWSLSEMAKRLGIELEYPKEAMTYVAVEEIQRHIKQGMTDLFEKKSGGRAFISAQTGTGKTKTIIDTLLELDKTALYLVPTNEKVAEIVAEWDDPRVQPIYSIAFACSTVKNDPIARQHYDERRFNHERDCQDDGCLYRKMRDDAASVPVVVGTHHQIKTPGGQELAKGRVVVLDENFLDVLCDCETVPTAEILSFINNATRDLQTQGITAGREHSLINDLANLVQQHDGYFFKKTYTEPFFMGLERQTQFHAVAGRWCPQGLNVLRVLQDWFVPPKGKGNSWQSDVDDRSKDEVIVKRGKAAWDFYFYNDLRFADYIIYADATGDLDLLNRITGLSWTNLVPFGLMVQSKARAIQYRDDCFTRQKLSDASNSLFRRVAKHMSRCWADDDMNDLLVITWKNLTDGVHLQWDKRIANFETAHFGNLRGLNKYAGRNVYVLSRWIWSPQHLSDLHIRYFHEPPQDLTYTTKLLPGIVDGFKTVRPATVPYDANLQALYLQKTRAELEQAIGRARDIWHNCVIRIYNDVPISSLSVIEDKLNALPELHYQEALEHFRKMGQSVATYDEIALYTAKTTKAVREWFKDNAGRLNLVVVRGGVRV